MSILPNGKDARRAMWLFFQVGCPIFFPVCWNFCPRIRPTLLFPSFSLSLDLMALWSLRRVLSKWRGAWSSSTICKSDCPWFFFHRLPTSWELAPFSFFLSPFVFSLLLLDDCLESFQNSKLASKLVFEHTQIYLISLSVILEKEVWSSSALCN